MTDHQIANALSGLTHVFTSMQRVRNRVVSIGVNSVVVESERTGVQRSVPFRDLRNAASVTRNGVIVRALAHAIGA